MPTDSPQSSQFLPREHIDLPKPPLDLPSPHLDSAPLPPQGHAEHTSSHETIGVKTLLSWHAPGRPFRKRPKEYYMNVAIITLILLVILFFLQLYVLMVVLLALDFVMFALTTVPPHDFRYRISTEGITVEDHFFLWQELYDFYFKTLEGSPTVIVRTKSYYPGALTIILGDMTVDHVKSALLPYLPFREYVEPTFVERSSDWLKKTFPLEKSPHASEQA